MNDDNEFAANEADREHDEDDALDARLSKELDAELGTEVDAELDAVLDQALAARIAGLPSSIEPPACLWADVAMRIEAERARKRVRRMRVASAIGTFAIAASIAIGLGVHAFRNGTTNAAEAQSGDAGRSTASSGSALHSAAPTILPDPSVPALLPEEPAYRAATQALRASLAESRSAMPARSANCIDDDLRIIDSAIDATRSALTKSPDNQVLRDALRDAYQQEIDVLADVIDLTSRT